MKLSKIWAIVQWVLASYGLIFSIIAFTTKGGIISGLLFLALAVLISPLRKKLFGLLPVGLQKKSIAIVSGIVLAIASLATFPTSETTQIIDETSEEVVERSMPVNEEAEETIKGEESNITALSFALSDDIELLEGKETSSSWVLAEVKDKDEFVENDVTFISANPEIATIEYESTALTSYLYYKVHGISAGETEVYAISKDGKIESEHIKVTVLVDEVKRAKEKAEAEKIEKEKDAAEEAARKAEEEKIAKEKAESQAAAETKTVSEQAVATEVVAAQQTDSSSGKTSGGGGNADSFNLYNNPEQQNTEATYVLNTNTMKFHKPSCKSVAKIKPENYATSSASRDEIIVQGFEPCGNCHP